MFGFIKRKKFVEAVEEQIEEEVRPVVKLLASKIDKFICNDYGILYYNGILIRLRNNFISRLEPYTSFTYYLDVYGKEMWHTVFYKRGNSYKSLIRMNKAEREYFRPFLAARTEKIWEESESRINSEQFVKKIEELLG